MRGNTSQRMWIAWEMEKPRKRAFFRLQKQITALPRLDLGLISAILDFFFKFQNRKTVSLF